MENLHTRFTSISALLAIMLISAIILSQSAVQSSQSLNHRNLDIQRQKIDISRHLHDALWNGYAHLENFLLNPSNKMFKRDAQYYFNHALAHAEQIVQITAKYPDWAQSNIKQLPSLINSMIVNVSHIIDTRENPTEQYPALYLSNIKLRPNRIDFNNGMSIIVNETLSIEQMEYVNEVYPAVSETRHLWTQMVSNFRIYLANRLGSFNESRLNSQEDAIKSMYVTLSERLLFLRTLASEDKLGFESSSSIEDIIIAANNWFDGYQNVQNIHQTDAWRADVQLMTNEINPALDNIWNILQDFDLRINESFQTDIIALNQSSEFHKYLLWGLVILTILLFVVFNILTRRHVLDPVTQVSNALRSENIDYLEASLPKPAINEIRDLIDAFSEMRSQVKIRQLALERQSLHDDLTDLPNRRMLSQQINQYLANEDNDTSKAALTIIDFRQFKHINDTLGHHIGDEVLKEIAQRLTTVIPDSITVARIGGDEFAIFCRLNKYSEIDLIQTKIYRILNQNILNEKLAIHVTPIIGSAFYPQHAKTLSSLMQKAEIALHHAKQSKLKYNVYNPEEDAFNVNDIALVADLKKAIIKDQLELYYQPKITLNTLSVTGVEALLRWNHPTYGWIHPEMIVSLAEMSGFIDELSKWVLTTGIRQCAKWNERGEFFNIAINLSATNLQDESIVPQIQFLLDQYQLPSNQLSLEITESAMMINPQKAKLILTEIENMGITISADDFGTGFSSLSTLKSIPIDEIKIDKSFILELVSGSLDTQIVQSSIQLAHSLGLNVVAEGIENQKTLDILNKLECDSGQGYFFSKPLPANALLEWSDTFSKPIPCLQ